MITMFESETSTSSSIPSQPCRQFQYPEILIATENFDESLVIGSGGFGKVYKGNVIVGGSVVVAAIKRLDSMSNQGAEEFWVEVEMLSTLSHSNLVSLIGYCHHENEMILVYEYMPNGTLGDHLHKLCTPLSWIQRLKICIDAGSGLRYLHHETGIDSGVIHRDVKSSNILLHESWAAKISDFGLSKTCPTNQPSTYVKTRVKGSFGYFDPSYYQTGMLTRKSDVYAFGVVLMEVLCRKRAVDKTLGEDQWSLVAWVQDSIREGKLKHIIDSDISGEISPKCLKDFVRLADRCLRTDPKQRPTMVEVVVSLENVRNIQERFSSSLRPASSRTIFGRMVDILPFTSNGETYVQGASKLSSSSKDNSRNAVRADNNMFPKKNADSQSPSPSPSLKSFRFADLKKATRKFSKDMLLGKGGFGDLFLGWVDMNTLAPSKHGDGHIVVVRRFSRHELVEWQTEMNILGQLAHPNIIRLLGYCNDEREHLLVYEYMPNKDLDHFLFKDNTAEPLSWGTRMLILIGVARGLAYLHSIKVIHRHVKPANIYLDEDFNAKLRDFGLAKYGTEAEEISTMIAGTMGYLDPAYVITGHVTTKSDIYSFGLVLLESISGRRALKFYSTEDPEYPVNWTIWATLIEPNRKGLEEIIDPRLEGNYPLQGASECFALALRCIAHNPKDRPSSEEVLQSLEKIYALNE